MAARALAAYKDFLTLWKDAYPDIPILKSSQDRVREAAVVDCCYQSRNLPSRRDCLGCRSSLALSAVSSFVRV